MNVSTSERVSNRTAGMGSNEDYWTAWFNVDRPWNDDGDYETVERIKHVCGDICKKGFEIGAAQCRIQGAEEVTFDKNALLVNNSDVLERYCTTEGLICKNSAQLPERNQCQDYSIQFSCHYTGGTISSNSDLTHFDIRVYIILAVVPVLLFLGRMLWVHVYRQRQERQRRNRANASRDGTDDSFAAGLTKPPPSYHDLFGKTRHLGQESPVFAISRDNVPICSLCQSVPCSVACIIGKNKIQDNLDVNRQTVPLEADRVAEQTVSTCLDTAVGSTNSVTREDTQSSVSSEMVPNHKDATVYTISTELIDEYAEVDSYTVSRSHNRAQEQRPVNDCGDAFIEIEISGQICTGFKTRRSSSSATGSDIKSVNSLLPLSLSPALLKLSKISQPCACPCHRTIPSKQKGVTSNDYSGSNIETIDNEANKYPLCPNMRVSALNHPRICFDLSTSTSVTEELPSYEYALELMKVKEAKSTQNSS